jgi:dipeptidyl aminopeptidase/acylaminoacyl peptidase
VIPARTLGRARVHGKVDNASTRGRGRPSARPADVAFDRSALRTRRRADAALRPDDVDTDVERHKHGCLLKRPGFRRGCAHVRRDRPNMPVRSLLSRSLGARGLVVAGIAAAVTASIPPAQAAFPGANGLIAFTRATSQGTDIAVVRPDRTGFRTLIRNAEDPAWSPDGRLLAFDRKTARGDWDLFVANTDGSDRRQLDHPGADEYKPSWAPDGSQLTYTDGQEIYVVNADLTERRSITDSDPADGAYEPDWSPSGEWIAFITQDGVITLIRPDGSDRHELPGDGTASNPTWSPDGRKLAYDAAGTQGWDDIYVSNADGTQVHQLTRSPGYEAAPAWSPDGSQIVFAFFKTARGVSQRHGDLYVMNADGSHVRPLVRGPASKWGADWQPIQSSPSGVSGLVVCWLTARWSVG